MFFSQHQPQQQQQQQQQFIITTNIIRIINNNNNNKDYDLFSMMMMIAWLVVKVTFIILLILFTVQLLEKYIRFYFFNPLRTNPNIKGPPITDNTNNNNNNNKCSSLLLHFLFGKFFVIRSKPFMEPQLEWIHQITKGSKTWDDSNNNTTTTPIPIPIPFIRYSLLFGQNVLLVLDKNIVKEILASPFGCENKNLRFVKDTRFLTNVLGSSGLITIEGSKWKFHRQIIQPAFYTRTIRDSIELTVPKLTKRFIQYWKSSSEGREIDVNSHLSSLTLDIIGQIAFSHNFHALDSVRSWSLNDNNNNDNNATTTSSEVPLSEIDDPLIQALNNSIKLTTIGLISILLGYPQLNKYFNPTTIRTRKALNLAVDQIISNAKEANKPDDDDDDDNNDNNKEDAVASSTTKATKPKSLLGLLLEASNRDNQTEEKKKKLSLNDVELRDHTTTFLFAGHETVATWCYMAIYSLVTYDGIQQKVYDDIIKHAPPPTTTTATTTTTTNIDLATIDKMEYFNAFLKEVLRLHPPVGMFRRYTAFDDDKLAGYTIPKGTALLISPYILHRHPKYWDEPLEFKPERWIHDEAKSKQNFDERIRFAFLPFSAGGRNCIGQNVAKFEAKLILAELIREFIFELAPSQKENNTKFTFSNIVVMRTDPKLRIVVHNREE